MFTLLGHTPLDLPFLSLCGVAKVRDTHFGCAPQNFEDDPAGDRDDAVSRFRLQKSLSLERGQIRVCCPLQKGDGKTRSCGCSRWGAGCALTWTSRTCSPAPWAFEYRDLEFRWSLRVVETVSDEDSSRVCWRKSRGRASTLELSIVQIGLKTFRDTSRFTKRESRACRWGAGGRGSPSHLGLHLGRALGDR